MLDFAIHGKQVGDVVVSEVARLHDEGECVGEADVGSERLVPVVLAKGCGEQELDVRWYGVSESARAVEFNLV